MRPRFSIELPIDVDLAMEKISEQLSAGEGYGRTQSAGRCVEMFVEDSDKRIWSPYLSVQVHREQQTTVLFGRFSPRPELWTFIMFLYTMNILIVVFGAIFAYVQWTLGEPAWGVVAIVSGVSLIAVIHIVSMVGQRLSMDQMHLLRNRLDQILEPLQTPINE